MKRIGIICAMELEADLLAKKIKNKKKIIVGNYQILTGEINEIPVAFIVCGIGKVAAATATTLLISKCYIKQIVHYGVCGAANGHQIGDIVIATSAYQGDFDLTAFGYSPCFNPTLKNHLSFCDDKMVKTALDLANELNISYHQGVICTKDQFISKEQIGDLINAISNFGALFFEMEGAAVAASCQLLNIPCIIIRSVSDIIGQDIEDYNNQVEPVAKNLSDFILKYINRA